MKTDRVSFELEGLESLLDAFKDIPDNIKKNAMTAVIRKSARKVEEDAKSLVRVDTGRLKNLIKARKRGSKYGDNFIKYTIGVPAGKTREDLKGAYYAPFIEFGTSKIPAKSFLVKALEQNSSETVREITKNIKSAINSRVKKHNAKIKKLGGST